MSSKDVTFPILCDMGLIFGTDKSTDISKESKFNPDVLTRSWPPLFKGYKGSPFIGLAAKAGDGVLDS